MIIGNVLVPEADKRLIMAGKCGAASEGSGSGTPDGSAMGLC